MSPLYWLQLVVVLVTSAQRIADAMDSGSHDDLAVAISDSIDDITDEVGLPVSDEVEDSLATVLVWLAAQVGKRPPRRVRVRRSLVRQLRGEVPDYLRRHIAQQRKP